MNSNNTIDLEGKMVNDTPYGGASPAIFRIKRGKTLLGVRGSKWEIKDENKKKFLEAKNVISGPKQIRKGMQFAKEIRAGKIVETTFYSLQKDKKTPLGEIVLMANYPQGGAISFRIKNESGNTLMNMSTAASLQQHLSGHPRDYYSQEPVKPEDYQIETGSGSFHLDVTQELTGRIQKRNHVLSIDILDSNNNKCLSLFQKKDDQFEATLYQGMSPFVANSFIILLAQSMWPPKPQSST